MILRINAYEWGGTLNGPDTPTAIDAGDIKIGLEENPAASTFFEAVVADETSVEISVVKDGYYPYRQRINNVYMTDQVLDIVLVPILVIGSPLYNRPVPRFFVFQDECSFDATFYVASSFPGNMTWYLNNEEYARNTGVGSVTFTGVGEYQVKLRGTVYDEDNDSIVNWDIYQGSIEVGNVTAGSDIQDPATRLAEDETTNLSVLEYRPDFTLDVSSPVDQLDSSNCYTRDETVTVTANIGLNRVNSNIANHVLHWSVIDPEGIAIIEDSTAATQTTQSWQLRKLGTYRVTVGLEDINCGITYERSIEVDTCNFIVFAYQDCGDFLISNRSSQYDIVYTVESIDGETSLGEDLPLPAGETAAISMDPMNPSIYFATATYTDMEGEEQQEIYVLNNYCIIEECFGEYILDILCEDTRRCAPCPDTVELNQYLLLHHTYFMELNSEYSWNNFYSGLEDSKLARLASIKQVMDKMVEFCQRRGCIKESNLFGQSARLAGAETYDYAGRGDNKSYCNCDKKSTNQSTPKYCKKCNS